jgi:hypothetical protein
MAKPAITKRAVKAAALTYAELDTNFQNLADATYSVTGGSGGTKVTADLNGNITLVAGTNVTLTANNTAKTITINSTGGGGGGIQIEAPPDQDTRYFATYGVDDGNTIIVYSERLSQNSTGTGINLTGTLLLHSYTTANRDLITSPTNGMLIYNSSTDKVQARAAGAWVDLH